MVTGASIPLRRRHPDSHAGELTGCSTSQTAPVARCLDMTTIPPSSRARMGRSRLGGVSTVLPPAASARQLPLPMQPAAGRVAVGRRELFPGAAYVPGWLDLGGQRALVAAYGLAADFEVVVYPCDTAACERLLGRLGAPGSL